MNIITSSVFEAYLKCPTKCFLRAGGEVGTGNLYADWVRTEAESYKNTGLVRLSEGFDPDEIATGLTGAIDVKTAKWRLAVDFTAPAVGADIRLHAVERIPSPGRGKSTVCIPIRFIFRNKLNADDKLLLAFDSFALSSVLGRAADTGKIIHGEARTVSKVKLAGLRVRVGKSIEKVAALLATATPPDLILRKHCNECEFQGLCRQKAVEKDDLSLLASINEKERKKLNSKGIFTVTQLSYTFRPRRRPRRLRNKRESHHHSLRALAIREKKIHVVGNPELKIEGTPVYLDVEGLPDRDFYYLIGVRVPTDGALVQHSLWANNKEDEKRIWTEFLTVLDGIENPVLIHYGHFETTFLKRMHDRYDGPPEDSAAAKAIKTPVNLLNVIFAQVYFPTYTNGLKEVAGSMGFNWSDAKASGVQSVVWRNTWEQSRDPAGNQALVQYNAEDCEALEIVTDTLVEITRPRRQSDDKAQMADDVVNVESMKRQWPFSFDNKTSSIQEMEFVRKAAYWSYQRDGVHFRDSDRRVRKARKVLAGCKTTSIRINKVVVNEVSPECPTCKRISAAPKALRERILYDLHFGHVSIKRWIVKYVFQTYLCWRCQLIFGLDKRFREKLKFGWNLVAYFVYQIIELAISQRIVTQSENTS